MPGWLCQLSILLLISAQVMISESWDQVPTSGPTLSGESLEILGPPVKIRKGFIPLHLTMPRGNFPPFNTQLQGAGNWGPIVRKEKSLLYQVGEIESGKVTETHLLDHDGTSPRRGHLKIETSTSGHPTPSSQA